MNTEKTFLALGEAMVEMAPTRGGLYKRGFAGDTLNTAWYLRACLSNSWTVGYITALGDDPLSYEMSDFMQQNGVDTTHIKHLPGKTPGLYLISLNQGERCFSYWRSDSAARDMVTDVEWLNGAIRSADHLFLSGITVAILSEADRETLLDRLKAFALDGGELSFDPNFRPRLWENVDSCRHWTRRFAALSTHVLPSFDDEQALFSDDHPETSCRRYQDLGAKTVVVKNGSRSVVYGCNDAINEVPLAHRVPLVDSTGAGDSFNGAYLAALASGASPEASIRRAMSLSAKVVSEEGALIAMSTLASIQQV